MADNEVTITFENDLLTDDFGNTARLTGSVNVDYTTNSYSGSYKVKNDSMDSGGDYYGTLTESDGTYSFTTSERFSLSYQGQTPTTARASYVQNTSETYSTANNPAGQRDQPVISNACSSSDTTADASTGTAVCFASGTLIRTARGEVAVERLVVGDLAVTASGEHRPIRWIGHRTIDPRRGPRPQEAMPVRVKARAFDADRPARDLVVSPGHALGFDLLGEVLVPALALVNGATVVQEEVERVTYWHVELDSHDILIAEDLPCESYLDMGNRAFFAETAVADLTAAPDATPCTHTDFCRPFHGCGPVVEAIRGRLLVRAEAMYKVLAMREAIDHRIVG